MSITKGSGNTVLNAVTTTQTVAGSSPSGDYVTQVEIRIVQVGTASAAASVQLQISLDGSTYFSPPNLLFTAGLTAATYDSGTFTIPITALGWKAAFTAQAGGSSSTCTVISNDVTGL